MSRKKIFSLEQLQTLTSEEIIDKIQHENYSLLKTLGAEKLRTEMAPVGKVCTLVINLLLGTTSPRKSPKLRTKIARKRLVKILSKIAPGDYADFPKDNKNGMVVGFNHPSLAEIVRIISMKIDLMGDKPMLFPVNLPWYETLSANYDKIFELGIIITPTITPSTWAKIGLKEDDERFEPASRIKHDFRNIYTNLSHEIIKKGGVIFVAPSATRQATVFKNKAVYDKKESIIPTMSILALELLKDPDTKCDFLPMAVLPPKKYKKGLNFFKKYRLIPGEIMPADDIRKKYFKTKNPSRLEGFDYDFHAKIAEKLPKEFWY